MPELADAIVVNTETGSSLRAHNLKIVDTLLISTTRLIVNCDSWQDSWKRDKIEKRDGSNRFQFNIMGKNC